MVWADQLITGIQPILLTQSTGYSSLAIAPATLVYRTGPAAGFTDTLPTAASLFAAYGVSSFVVYYANQSTQTATLAAGTGGVLIGTANVATLRNVYILVIINSASVYNAYTIVSS